MVKSYLIEILKTFIQKEIKEFGEFVRSPYYNKNESVIKLYDYLRKCYPEFTESKVLKEHVHKKIFPGVKYNDSFMRKIMFNLQRLLEEYLQDLYTLRDTLQRDINFLLELERRNHIKLLKKKLPEVENTALKTKRIEGDHYQKMHDIEFIKEIILIRELTVKNKNNFGQEIQKRPVYTIKSFLSKILANYYVILNQSLVINYKPELEFFDEICLFLENNKKYLDDPKISFKYYSVLLLKNMEQKHYFKLKEVFINNINNVNNFSSGDIYNISIILLNHNHRAYSIHMESSFLDEMLELYEIIIRNKIYSFHSGMYLQSKIFMNIVFMAIMNDKKEWLEEFIKEHNRKIDPEFREHLLNFAKARILFSECKYEDVLVKISRIKDIKDSDILLSLRDFQLMIYFELDMVESIFLEIDSYSHFLKKETSLPEARRTLYKNFLKIYNKVFLMKLNDEVHNASDIRNELILLENIDEREWLNEKINQIEKSAQKAN